MKNFFMLLLLLPLSFLSSCDRRQGKGSDVQFQQEHPGYGPGTGSADEYRTEKDR